LGRLSIDNHSPLGPQPLWFILASHQSPNELIRFWRI